MKKLIITIALFFITGMGLQAQITYYYTTISNQDLTIDYDFGFYPSTASYVETAGLKPYTAIKAAIINQATAEPFESKDDKVMILLKSGKLIRNYTTVAEEGEYAVNYTTDPGETRYQAYCFEGRVDIKDISRIWYVLGDNEIFELKTAQTE